MNLITEIKNGKLHYIANESELADFKQNLDRANENPLMGYDETYNEDDGVCEGYVHYEKEGNFFFLSKNK